MGAWSPNQLAILREHWPTKTSGEIAEMIGKTRNAVMGMAHRLALPPKSPSGNKRKSRKPYKPRPEPKPEPVGPVPLMEAKHDQCRAVIEGIKDKDGLAMICGKPIVWGQSFSFCSKHLAKYTTKGVSRVRP